MQSAIIVVFFCAQASKTMLRFFFLSAITVILWVWPEHRGSSFALVFACLMEILPYGIDLVIKVGCSSSGTAQILPEVKICKLPL